jgi:copper(I)-binding protein
MFLFTALRQSSARSAALVFIGLVGVGGTFAQQKPVSTATPLVKVEAAWVRATVQGQLGTGAFMNLTASTGTQLVGVSTPSAAVAEVHEMKMEGDVMKMRAVSALDLPAGKTVQLKPGGYHLMLMELKQPLAKGSSMPLTLLLKDAKGVESKLQVQVPVLTAAPAGVAAGTHSSHQHPKP